MTILDPHLTWAEADVILDALVLYARDRHLDARVSGIVTRARRKVESAWVEAGGQLEDRS